MFWFICFLLVVLAALFVLFPLWQSYRLAGKSSANSRTDTNLSIYEDRKQELETDLASGSLDQEQYQALLRELQKTLLSDTSFTLADNKREDGNKKSKSKDTGRKKVGPIASAVPLVLALLVPAASFLLYQQWGYLDDVELMDLYQRTVDSANDPEQASELITPLIAVITEDEENEWAHFFLGRNLANLGMFNEAEVAFRRASELMDDGPDKAAVLGMYAQMKYITGGGELTDEVTAILDQALEINPAEFGSLQLLSLIAEAAGDFQAAIGYWRLMIQADPNSQGAQQLRERISQAQAVLALQEGGVEDAGPTIDVNVQLEEGLEFPPGLRVFIAARNAEREGMPPLAATDLLVSDLPTTVTLDNNLAVGPFNLSSAATVFITATVSMSGSATVQSGDYRVVSQNFAPNGEHAIIDLVISERVP